MDGPRRLLTPLLIALLLAGCTGSAEPLKEFERVDFQEDDDAFVFTVPKGVKRIQVVSHTQGLPESVSSVSFYIVKGPGEPPIYSTQLAYDGIDRQKIDVKQGQYYGLVQYHDDYVGPATMVITPTGAGSLVSIGGSFWDILGVTLALVTLSGGWLLYRRHTNRLGREMDRIDETFRDLRADIEQCRHELHDMQQDLQRQLMQGRLKESHYLILEKRIERYLEQLDRLPATSRVRDAEVPLEFE